MCPLFQTAAVDVGAVVEIAAGVDNDDVDSPELAGGGVERSDDRFVVRDVRSNGGRVPAVPLNFVHRAGEVGLAPCDAANPRAGGRVAGGDRLSDSPACAGDYGHFAGQFAVCGHQIFLDSDTWRLLSLSKDVDDELRYPEVIADNRVPRGLLRGWRGLPDVFDCKAGAEERVKLR